MGKAAELSEREDQHRTKPSNDIFSPLVLLAPTIATATCKRVCSVTSQRGAAAGDGKKSNVVTKGLDKVTRSAL